MQLQHTHSCQRTCRLRLCWNSSLSIGLMRQCRSAGCEIVTSWLVVLIIGGGRQGMRKGTPVVRALFGAALPVRQSLQSQVDPSRYVAPPDNIGLDPRAHLS